MALQFRPHEGDVPVAAGRPAKVAAACVSVLLLVMAAACLVHPNAVNIACAVLLAGIAVGQWRRLEWARWGALLALWSLVVFSLGSIFPESYEGVAPADIPVRSNTELALRIAAIGGAALAAIHVLGRYKRTYAKRWW